MKHWNHLAADPRVDAIAAAVQRVCLLVMVAVEFLFFLPGEAADGIVYLFLEWKLVDISILFLAASFCRKYLRQSKPYFLLALVMVIWFYAVRIIHLQLEGANQNPGSFVCAYLLCLPFAAASEDGEACWGLKALAAVFLFAGALFGGYALMLVLGRLPAFLDGYVFWDGARFGAMGHPNICATVLMVSIGLWAGIALSLKQRWLKCLTILMIAFQFSAMSLTNSRTTIVLTCLLLGGIVFCAVRKNDRKRLVPALLAAAAVAGVLFGCSRALFNANQARLLALLGELKTENSQGTFVQSMKNLNGRTEIWAGSIQALRDNPILLLTGTEHAGKVISPYWRNINVLHAHNAWLQTLFQLGIPGLLAALALTVLAVWDCVAMLWRNDSPLHVCIALVTLCLMGCAMLEPYLFTVYLQFHHFDFLFLLCLGYLSQWRKDMGGARENAE